MPSSPEAVREFRKLKYLQDSLREHEGRYHSFQLPDGTILEGLNPLERLQKRYASYALPESLAGKTLLDIGAWDGWFTFEAEKHGARVTAIDCVEIPRFIELHRRYGSSAEYRVLDFYDLPSSALGPFDYVFFMGVLYHLKHPLLALEIVCALTREVAIVESFVTDGDTWREHATAIPTMEFYETTELGEQMDNWIGPSVSCLLAMCRAAGFARVELIETEAINARVACHRRWPDPPTEPTERAPVLAGVAHARNFGINFSTRREEYISWWFQAEGADLMLEVDGFGVPVCFTGDEGGGWRTANCRVPPGLAPGWKTVRLRTAGSAYSNEMKIAVDLPFTPEHIEIRSLADAAAWTPDELDLSKGSAIACWIAGLPENADLANVRAQVGGKRARVAAVGPLQQDGCRQVNVEVPEGVPAGSPVLRVVAGAATAERAFRLCGAL